MNTLKLLVALIALAVTGLGQSGGAGAIAISQPPPSSGPGSGDVVGPASSTNNAWALWDGTTGKLLKDSNVTYVTPTLTGPAAFTIAGPGALNLSPTTNLISTAPLNAFNVASGVTPFVEFEVDSSSTSSPRGVMSAQFSTTTDGARFHMRKGRGTRASPSVVVTGDNLGRLVASGYDGSNYIETASILLGSTGTIASTRVPSYIEFYTGTNAAPTVSTAAAKFDSDQGLKFPSTNTVGLQLYNTADQTTNYERLELFFTSNNAVLRTVNGGSGTLRALTVSAGNGGANVTMRTAGNSSGVIQFAANLSTNVTNNIGWNFSNLTSTATSGTITGLAITPTYNQASGTAANTDLQITRTETAVGSGAQNLIAAGTAALGNQFTVNNRGGVSVSYQSLSGAGAVNVTNYSTEVTSTGGAQALTLADGAPGQIKVIVHGVDGGSSVLTPTTKTGFNTITFTNAGESATLQFFTTRGWIIISLFGAVAA